MVRFNLVLVLELCLIIKHNYKINTNINNIKKKKLDNSDKSTQTLGQCNIFSKFLKM